MKMAEVECGGGECLAVNNSRTGENYPFAGDFNDSELSFYFVFYKLTVPLLFSFVALFGVAGNLLVIYVVLSTIDMRRNTVNILLVNLAVSDFTFSALCVPFIAYHYAADNWTIGSVACKLSQYLIYVTTYVTVYTLVAVAIVRVYKVTSTTASSRDERHVTAAGRCCHDGVRQVSLVVAALWSVALTANLPVIFSYRIKTYVTYNYCGIEDETHGRRIVVAFFVLAYVAPLVVIASTYFTLLHHVRRHARHSSVSVNDNRAAASLRANVAAARRASTLVSRRASRVTRVLIIVVVVFAVCWLPLHVHLLIAYFGVQPARRWYEVYRVLAHCLAYANSCMNPIIYSYVNTDFRRRFADVMLAPRTCQRQSSTTDEPEIVTVRMRNASYEAIALEEPGRYIEVQETPRDEREC